jgi:hypothetical protein
MTVQSVLVLHVLIGKVSAGSAGPARDTCVQEYMLHKLPDTLYSSRCWTARFSRSFASACTPARSISQSTAKPASAITTCPLLSQACIHRFRITLAAHHQSLLTAPAYPARDVFVQRHASPSSKSTGFENKSTVTVTARETRCAAGSSSHHSMLPWSSLVLRLACPILVSACDSVLQICV